MIKEDWSKCPNLTERGESIKTLKFEGKVGNQSKCWNLSANGQIDQNVEIWVLIVKIDQNVGSEKLEINQKIDVSVQ